MPIDPNEQPQVPPRIDPSHELPAPPPRRSRWLRVFVWLLILVIFALVMYWVMNRRNDAQKSAGGSRRAMQGAVPVIPVAARKGDLGVYLDAIGTVTPVYTASISSQVNGMIVAVNYHEGQHVSKGQSLIEIDSRQYRANLLQAQGTLERDQGVLAQAQMDLDRYRTAWNKNAIARQQLEDQEKLVAQDQGTVKQDQGTVQYDQVQVDYCHIVAPISGRAGLRLVDPGNVVAANGGTTLVVVTQEQPTTVVFTLPEDAIGQVTPHLKKGTRLTVDAYDRGSTKKIASGILLTVDNQIDTTTGTVKARAQFENRDGSLYPNEFVNTRLLVDTLRGVTLLPTSTIQHNGDTTFVYVLANNKAQIRSVKAGVTDGDTTQVTGVNPGEVVANSSFDKLQPNAEVRIARQGASPTRSGGSNAP